MALEQKWRLVELDAVIATKTYNVMVSILRLSGFSVCIPYREGVGSLETATKTVTTVKRAAGRGLKLLGHQWCALLLYLAETPTDKM